MNARRMVHKGDPQTSLDAAERIMPKIGSLHLKVLAALTVPMTDEELELLDEFHGYGPSTIRKRRSELYQLGKVVGVAERKNSRGQKMIVWARVTQHEQMPLGL